MYNYIPLYIVIPYILDTQKKTHMFVGAMWENGEIKIVWKGSWPFLEWPDFGVCPTCGSGSLIDPKHLMEFISIDWHPPIWVVVYYCSMSSEAKIIRNGNCYTQSDSEPFCYTIQWQIFTEQSAEILYLCSGSTLHHVGLT